MKVSQIGLISKKITNLDKQFPVQDMLLQTGQVEQFSSGIYAYGHIPYLVEKNIESLISKTLTKYNCSVLSLPLLQPENIWQESGRLEKYISEDVMFRCLTDKGNYCLAPTAEEAIVKYAKNRLTSYKQLPVTYFQIGEKFRNEIRTRGYLLRGKSFTMMDAYSFGRNQKDLDEEYENIKQAYLEIFNTLGLKVEPVGADSGAIGGNKSEEFMCISDIGEDNILYDASTGTSFNEELLEHSDYKEYLKNNYGINDTTTLKKRKAVELGHIFKLGDKYSKSMNATYIDEFSQNKNYIMGCYGIGVSRTLAMLYENSIVTKDNKFTGIALPINISPYLIYIIPKDDDSEKSNIATSVYQELLTNEVPVLYDDRINLSVGSKIKDSQILGIPYTVVFGKTLEDNHLEIENNKTHEKIKIELNELIPILKELSHNRNTTIENILSESR